MEDNISTLNKELVDSEISIDDIFLDPNNPRFVSKNWNEIATSQIMDSSIQNVTKLKLQQEFAIDRLVENIKINGFLTIDRIIVKKISDNKYVVLEGNRRICAAKTILDEYRENAECVSSEVIESLLKIKFM